LNARQAYEKLEKPFDCYLLDIGLPDGNGLEICSYIRTFSNRPILILSADRTEESILKGYASLADDYLEKPFLLSVLQAKIKALMHRAGVYEEKIASGPFSLDLKSRKLAWKGNTLLFNPSECALVEELLKHEGKSVERSALIQNVFARTGKYPTDETLNVRMSGIKKKLAGAPVQIDSIYQKGYSWSNL
jgi:DNA-binding response OmpR family regulator